MSLTVSTSAFSSGGNIPAKFTCDDADVSPLISWSGAPAGTREFALICDDPDAPSGTFTHWVIWGIPGNRHELPEGVAHGGILPSLSGARQGTNDFGVEGYRGPCPPKGKPHRYFFRLYALDAPPSVSSDVTADSLRVGMRGHILAQGELVGKYGR